MAKLFNIPNVTDGMDTALVDLSTDITVFPIMFLVFVFSFIFLGGMAAQGKKSGYVDPPIWATLGFLTIDLIALIFSLQLGIIAPVVLAVCFSLTFISAFWLFFTRGRFEN